MIQRILLSCAVVIASSLPAVAFQVNTQTLHSQYPQSIAIGGDGNVTVVWRDTDNPTKGQYFSRFDSDGVTVGATTQVTDDSTSEPEVSAASDGSFVVVWDERDKVPILMRSRSWRSATTASACLSERRSR